MTFDRTPSSKFTETAEGATTASVDNVFEIYCTAFHSHNEYISTRFLHEHRRVGLVRRFIENWTALSKLVWLFRDSDSARE